MGADQGWEKYGENGDFSHPRPAASSTRSLTRDPSTGAGPPVLRGQLHPQLGGEGALRVPPRVVQARAGLRLDAPLPGTGQNTNTLGRGGGRSSEPGA